MQKAVARDVLEGLQEYYPALRQEDNQKAVEQFLLSRYVDTGNNQADYENLRDALELEIKAKNWDLYLE